MQLMARKLHSHRQQGLSAIALSWHFPRWVHLSRYHDRLRYFHFFFGQRLLLPKLIVLLLGITIAQPVAAQPANPLATNITLSPKFSPDPLEIRGISGGSVEAKDVVGRSETQTGACNGFVDAEPDHTVVLNAFFSHLSLKIQSPQDTTLVIKGPGGIWCNDDHEGKNPGIAGEWLAGTYQIWIGSYDKTKYVPYILRITEAR